MSDNVSIVGIPYDEQSSFMHGCAGGPNEIRKAFNSDSSNTFCEAGFDIQNHSQIHDVGNLAVSGGEAARHQIEQEIAGLVNSSQRVLSLGGDHSITYPILRGMHSKFGAMNVLYFDAHPDLYDELDGNRFSHATPMARASEQGLIKRLVQVGIRTMTDHQQSQAERFGVEVVSMSNWTADWRASFEGPVYLSLDLDVLDPAFVPGVSHYEPGGFTTRELIRMIQSLDIELVGADIVELNPVRDIQSVTAMTAAKLMKELLAKMVA